MSWNVEGLNSEKQNNSDFSKFIADYEIIVLYETFTTKKSKIELSGYSKPIHSYRRFRNRRAKRASGGVIIYIKDELRKGIKLVKNDVDSIIWIKLDKTFLYAK